MKKFIDIVNEGIDPRSNHPAFANDTVDDAAVDGADFNQFDHIFAPLHLLVHRNEIDEVYRLVLDEIPFEDAIDHIAKRAHMERGKLRELVIKDYKLLRSDSDTYATPIGHMLVGSINPQINETLEEAVREYDDSVLVERMGHTSQKCGAYTNAQGNRLLVIRAQHDKNHHMVVNQKGEVVKSHHGDPQELHDALTADGFQGAITRD